MRLHKLSAKQKRQRYRNFGQVHRTCYGNILRIHSTSAGWQGRVLLTAGSIVPQDLQHCPMHLHRLYVMHDDARR